MNQVLSRFSLFVKVYFCLHAVSCPISDDKTTQKQQALLKYVEMHFSLNHFTNRRRRKCISPIFKQGQKTSNKPQHVSPRHSGHDYCWPTRLTQSSLGSEVTTAPTSRHYNTHRLRVMQLSSMRGSGASSGTTGQRGAARSSEGS